jgi:hypothetical protein
MGNGIRRRGSRRSRDRRPNLQIFGVLVVALTAGVIRVSAEEDQREPVRAERPQMPKRERERRLAISLEQRERLDTTVDKALEYLASRQNSDGSFQTVGLARPAVTALCVMAFFSRGHKPGEGRYGAVIERGIDYVLDCQDLETGAIASPVDDGGGGGGRGIGMRAVNYTHGICGMMLADAYPLTGRRQHQPYSADSGPLILERNKAEQSQSDRAKSERAKAKEAKKSRARKSSRRERPADDLAKADLKRHERIEKAVKKALAYTRREQNRAKSVLGEQGGWRYSMPMGGNDSDLSVTAWQIMFLHSAMKSGFKVPDLWIKGGLKFVHHTYSKKLHGFVYVLSDGPRHCTRATVGGGILCILLGGEPITQDVRDAAEWVAYQTFEPYNISLDMHDRYHYSAFYCSQAMGVLGGEYFYAFYPRLLRVLSENQHPDGSWDPEAVRSDTIFGEVYTTALAVLALSPPYENLKTYER